MQAPSLYGYFGSKHEIYDAMFAMGAQQFVDAEPWDQLNGDALHDVRCIVRYVVRFCSEDIARYQLLFQRPIPGFEPSPESFAISEGNLARLGEQLARVGITDACGRPVHRAQRRPGDPADLQRPGRGPLDPTIDDAAEMYVQYMTGIDEDRN